MRCDLNGFKISLATLYALLLLIAIPGLLFSQTSLNAINEPGSSAPKLTLNISFDNVITIPERITWSDQQAYSPKPFNLLEVDLYLSSPKFATISLLREREHAAYFERIRDWQLSILAEDTTVFDSLTSTGKLPREIIWDGLSATDEPVLAGKTYSYRLTITDLEGNRTIFPGQSFMVTAFRLYNEDKVITALTGEEVFSYDALHYNPGANRVANALARLIHILMASGSVSVTSSNPNADVLIDWAARELIAGQKFFEITSLGNPGIRPVNFYLP